MPAADLKLKRGTFKHVESELYAYPDTIAEIERLRAEILHSSPSPDVSGGGRGNLPGDPTASKGTRLATHHRLLHLEAVADAIRSVYESLPEEKKQLIKIKYWTRPQRLTWDGIAMELHVSRATALRWRDEIVYAVAERLGWR